MKKSFFAISVTAAAFLAACGESTTENVTQINQMGMEVVKSVEDLPKCTADNEGEIAWVKGENSSRVCVDGKWFATKDTLVVAGDTVYMDGGDFSCTTKELKDKSGIKIICNGDSIGVVLNGADGKQGIQGEQGLQGDKGDPGDAGEGCAIAGQSDTTVTIKCGGKSMTMNIGAGGFSVDTLALDSEKVATPIASLDGYTQKGPFLKGSTVYLYELSDGRTLRQTNGNFMSYITSDDGRYQFNARNLVSQYAMVVVDGNYRNEVTGKNSERPIRLRAITDVTARSSANVNLLTNLEFDRVYYLVTQKKMKVRNAKKQAQAEIFKAFHIDTTGFTGSSEDLDVFGKTNADAALLAISILLQGDSSETALSVLLTEIANDMATDGKWDGPGSDSVKARLADWAFDADGRLSKFRDNVKKWGLSNTVPEFEKYVRRFWNVEKQLVKCDDVNEGALYETPYKKATLLLRCEDGVWSARGLKDSRDGHEYRIVKIGDQVWMAENLNFEYKVKPTDGDSVVYGNNCYLNNCDSDSSMLFGRYYSWAAAMDSAGIYSANGKDCGEGLSCLPAYPVQGICPEGWHLPDSTEWEQLYSAMGRAVDGMIAGEWKRGMATDDYGFSAYPVGHYEYSSSSFDAVGLTANFWSAAGQSFWKAKKWFIGSTGSLFESYGKRNGFSVRCVKGEGSSSASTSVYTAATPLNACGDLWCGFTDVTGRVETGSEEETSGYWFDFSDEKDFGSSRIVYPEDVEEDPYGNFFGPLTEEYGGIKGAVILGSGYDYPYAGLAFNLANFE